MGGASLMNSAKNGRWEGSERLFGRTLKLTLVPTGRGQKKQTKNWGHSSLCVVCFPHSASSDGWSLLLGEVWGHQSQNGWCQGGPFLGLIRDWPESPFQNNKNRMQFCRLKNTNMIFVSLETVPVHDVDYNTVCTFIFPQNIQSGPCQSSLTFSPRHIF